MLESKIDEASWIRKNSVADNNSGNSRNEYYLLKIIKSEWDEAGISVPRNCNGTFEPKAIEKRQTCTDEVEKRILAMYAKGMSTYGIEEYIQNRRIRKTYQSKNRRDHAENDKMTVSAVG